MSTEMIEALHASGPHLELADKLQLFGQFIGSWDVDVVNYLPDGSRRAMAGEWHFGWVLEGRAIQDVWIAPRRGLRAQLGDELGDHGATLRFFDPRPRGVALDLDRALQGLRQAVHRPAGGRRDHP